MKSGEVDISTALVSIWIDTAKADTVEDESGDVDTASAEKPTETPDVEPDVKPDPQPAPKSDTPAATANHPAGDDSGSAA